MQIHKKTELKLYLYEIILAEPRMMYFELISSEGNIRD